MSKNVKINLVSDNWKEVLSIARATVGKSEATKEPSTQWKTKILISEHSPIRLITILWEWIEIKTWVSQHFSRHNKYAEHFVRTQRNDRTGKKRDDLRQDTPVNHAMHSNASEIIQISRKRLCTATHRETTGEWKAFLIELAKKEPELAGVCVRECVYRGGLCPEPVCCGFIHTNKFANEFSEYRKKFSGNYANIDSKDIGDISPF